MKVAIFAMLAVLFSAESFAQRVVIRGTPSPGRVINRPGPTRPGPVIVDRRPDYRPGPVIVNRRPDYRPGPVIVGPRYNPNRYSTRVIRTYRRDPYVWTNGFGFTCGAYGDLQLNGSFVHNFRFSQDCYTALEDIRLYTDFCDGEDLYDQTGMLQAQFTFDYECRQALGYYY